MFIFYIIVQLVYYSVAYQFLGHFQLETVYFQIIVMYLQVLGFQNNQKLMQYSWNYMNDSLRTDVFVRYFRRVVRSIFL